MIKNTNCIIYKEVLKTNYQQVNVSKKILFCFILLFLGLMSAIVTHAETYTFVTKWGSYGTDDGQFDYPIVVALDSSDNVYVNDMNNNRIQKFDDRGSFITKWGSYGTGDGQFHIPWYVAVDSLGNVYVADTNNNRIQKFDSSGSFITKWDTPGSYDGLSVHPTGIAVDSSGNVYVCAFSNIIQKYDSTGTFIAQWGSLALQPAAMDNLIVLTVSLSILRTMFMLPIRLIIAFRNLTVAAHS